MSQNFQELYKEKLVSVEEAAALLKDNAVCATDISLAQAESFYTAVGQRVREGSLKNITQHALLSVGPRDYFNPELKDNYHGVSWFSGVAERTGVNGGYGDILPAYYRDMPNLMANYVQPEILVEAVSPMDKHGYFSCGCDSSITYGILASAKTILLEVNDQMPRSLAGPQIHISQVTALWEDSHPLRTLTPPVLDETSKKIGAYIAEEIPDGATLQLGIGAIPDAVGGALKEKHHLGIHTEMFTDSMIDLLECGAVDNTLKPIHTGKTVATFALGSQRMYDFIDDNPMMEMLPVDYVNDPYVICQHPNFISVNAALEVDFFGQVCAESVGTRHVSGTGGQSDYVRGATQSKGGKSFIAFASTAKNDTISKIVPTLAPGAQVSTSKNDVDNIVTEYGIARLRGRTLSQRTKALIAIAHPKFRDELTFAAKKENILI